MKRKRKGISQNANQRKATIKNFQIFRLKGMLTSLKSIAAESTKTAPYGAAILAIKEIIEVKTKIKS